MSSGLSGSQRETLTALSGLSDSQRRSLLTLLDAEAPELALRWRAALAAAADPETLQITATPATATSEDRGNDVEVTRVAGHPIMAGESTPDDPAELTTLNPLLVGTRVAAGAEGPPPTPIDARAGQQLGPFRLLHRVGRGGMGEVWLAERRSDDLLQRVAVKLLQRGHADHELQLRFVRERRILASLDHPGIARFIDAGLTPDGLPYYVMEYVDGRSLTRHAAEQELGLRQRVQLLAEVCDAVAYAQQRLVVHRDLKPGNILVDVDGRVRLLDFGIAKLLEDQADPELTATGLQVMSPAYAAPEQILGGTISTATDVYALGLILYELLTGHLPESRRSGSLAALAASAHSQIESPSVELRRLRDAPVAGIDPLRFSRELDPDLERILQMALRPEPERRYAGAQALAEDLRRWLAGAPVRAVPDSVRYRLGKFLARHRVGVAAATLALFALLAGFSVALWQAQLARDARALAEAEAQRAEAEAREALATKNFVVTAFDQVSPLRARAGTQLTLAEFLKGTLDRLDQSMQDAPASRAELRVSLAGSLSDLGDYEAAEAQLLKAEADLRAIHPGSHRSRVQLLHRLALNASGRGDAASSRRHAEEALQLLDALPERERDPALLLLRVQVETNLARSETEQVRYSVAIERYRRILAAREALLGPASSGVAVDHLNLCASYWYVSAHRAGELHCRRAWQLLEADPEAPGARYAWIDNSLGLVLAGQGRHAEAMASFERGEAQVLATLGEAHPMLRTLQGNRGALLHEMGEYRVARELTAAALARAIESGDRRVALQRRVQLAATELMLDQPGEALALAAQALAEREAVDLPAAHPIILRARAVAAGAKARLGRLAEAEAWIGELLEELAGSELQGRERHLEALQIAVDIATRAGQPSLALQRGEELATRTLALATLAADPGPASALAGPDRPL